MKKWLVLLLAAGTLAARADAKEFHVAIDGNDGNRGSKSSPFRTIQHAADLAKPGDTITVHAGVYRERVNPPRGGTSDRERIVYQAARGEKVEIAGSEVIPWWTRAHDDIWTVTLPNTYFGDFNPFTNVIHGDWFNAKNRIHHTGAVYIDGTWLNEAASLDDVTNHATPAQLWFAEVNADGDTTLWARFKTVDPTRRVAEINARRTVFYPDKCGVNYITVRGFTLRDAATPWAPPTAEQVGLIGTHWSKGWIIESNIIRHSACSGIALGKYGDEWDNRSESAEGYVATIRRALSNGWNKATVGSHIVRGNDISECEQSGIVGSLGAAFSVVTGNTIHDIHVRQLFSGAEMAGIKFHGGIDVQITRNRIYHCCGGLWLDWMAQGARVSQNLFHDNLSYDLFFEVDHGPILVDNNIFLSGHALESRSRGCAFAHNLFAGAIHANAYDPRSTPFHKPHSTELAGFHGNSRGDDRYYNNLFVQHADLSQYDSLVGAVAMDGNVFLTGAKPSILEKAPLVQPSYDPALRLANENGSVVLKFDFDDAWTIATARKLVTTDLLGRAQVPDALFENPDGSPVRIDTDYFGKRRSRTNPAPGPFENPSELAHALAITGLLPR
jgi:alpha-N-arabinofuranosidase